MLTIIKETLGWAALPAALWLASSPAVIGRAEVEAATLSTAIHVRAVVLAHAELTVLEQPAGLVVTGADVRQGFVRVPETSVLELKNNTRTGCLLSLQAQGFPYREATVSVGGKDFVLGPNGGFVTLPVTGKTTLTLSYRFVLLNKTLPGTYQWPFTLSVSPL